tara:strand:- start:2878 stop:3006 length:129 start_codon:yes stop_codon:yes gene_type:complete
MVYVQLTNGFDKTLPTKDFPYRNKEEFLIDAKGNLVKQIEET